MRMFQISINGRGAFQGHVGVFKNKVPNSAHPRSSIAHTPGRPLVALGAIFLHLKQQQDTKGLPLGHMADCPNLEFRSYHNFFLVCRGPRSQTRGASTKETDFFSMAIPITDIGRRIRGHRQILVCWSRRTLE